MNAPPTIFEVGRHAVAVSLQAGRWVVSVDVVPAERTYDTQAEAWEAGVREAARLDAA